MRQTDRGSFCNGRVTHQCRLHFSSSQTMTGDFDDIVHAADDPVIAVLVAFGGIACGVTAWEFAPVLADVAFIIVIDCPQHCGPRMLERQITFRIVWDRVALLIRNFLFLPKEKTCSRSGFRSEERRGG